MISCATISRLLCTAAVIVVCILFLFGCTTIPKKLGFYRWLTTLRPPEIGLTPAHHYGIEWKYTFEELYNSSQNNLSGQTALITGANSGVGYETALALARLGCSSVTIACRNERKCEVAANKIRSDDRFDSKITTIHTMLVDMSSLKSVRNLAANYSKFHNQLDMLYLNAGVASVKSAQLSEDGIQKLFATNYLGHHLLYRLLEPIVMNSTLPRIIVTSSAASFETYDYKVATDLQTLNKQDHHDFKMYGQSKLAQILWVKELHRQTRTSTNSKTSSPSLYVNAVHPGAVDTGIWDNVVANNKFSTTMQSIINFFRKNVMWNSAEGALTMLYLGVATDQLVHKNISGKYFHPQAQEVVNPLSLDEVLQKKLWQFSDELIKDFVADIGQCDLTS